MKRKPAARNRAAEFWFVLPAGTPITIKVVKPGGAPAVGASVFVGRTQSTHIGNCLKPARADSKGIVHLGCNPGLSSLVTATLEGFGPARSAVAAGTEAQEIILQRIVLLDPTRLPGFLKNKRG